MIGSGSSTLIPKTGLNSSGPPGHLGQTGFGAPMGIGGGGGGPGGRLMPPGAGSMGAVGPPGYSMIGGPGSGAMTPGCPPTMMTSPCSASMDGGGPHKGGLLVHQQGVGAGAGGGPGGGGSNSTTPISKLSPSSKSFLIIQIEFNLSALKLIIYDQIMYF